MSNNGTRPFFLNEWQIKQYQLTNKLFIAAPGKNGDHSYSAVWLRDNLYVSLGFYYLGEYSEAWSMLRRIFDTLKYSEAKIIRINKWESLQVPEIINLMNPIYTKYNQELFGYDNWGNHQLDALGLFLFTLAFFEAKGIQVVNKNDQSDIEFLQQLVWYTGSVRYALWGDFGWWEECLIGHTSSIGAVLSGLYGIRDQNLAMVPGHLFQNGHSGLHSHLPYESRHECARHPAHSHCCDAGQLSLIWPFNIVSREMADVILSRLIDGHTGEDGVWHRLRGEHGVKRYRNDNFFGYEAEWPMFFFWLSIIYSHRGEYHHAEYWYLRGCQESKDGYHLPELVVEGWPNDHTPLIWAHAISSIAFCCLHPDQRERYK